MLAGAGVHAAPRRWRTAVATMLLCALAAENYMAYPPPLPSNDLPVPAIFTRVAAGRPTTVLVLPMLRQTVRWPDEADYLQFVLPSWTPIVSGYGRRTSFTYEAVREALDVFPRQPHFIDALRFYGVSHVVVLPSYARKPDAGIRRRPIPRRRGGERRLRPRGPGGRQRALPGAAGGRAVTGRAQYAGPSSTAFMNSSIVASV
jgi:hypothetical protein